MKRLTWLIRGLKREFPPRASLARVQLQMTLERLAGRKIVILDLPIAGQAAYLEPLLERLRDLDGGKIVYYLAVGNGVLAPDIDRLSMTLRVPKSHLLSEFATARIDLAHMFISATQWARFPVRGNIRICVFHGLPSKGVDFEPNAIAGFGVLFLLGPLMKELYEEFAIQYPGVAAWIKTFDVGYPKSDELLNGRFKKADVLQQLQLPMDRPTVVYAPSFEKEASLHIQGKDIIETLLGLEVNVIVKLHPMSYHSTSDIFATGGIDWPQELSCFETHHYFRHVPAFPIDPLLAASDVMITDVSGVALEFILLDRPVIYIDCPRFYDEYLPKLRGVDAGRARRDVHFNVGRDAGLVVAGPADLPQAVQRSLEHPEEFGPQRRALRDRLLYNPGRAAEVAAQTILELLGLGHS